MTRYSSNCLPPNSEPQPDIALLRPRSDWYRNALPAASDVILLVEIADTTLAYDRDIKVPLYARHGIAEVWLVDLAGGVVEIHLEPGIQGYRKILRPDRSETISPALLSAVQLPSREIWPG